MPPTANRSSRGEFSSWLIANNAIAVPMSKVGDLSSPLLSRLCKKCENGTGSSDFWLTQRRIEPRGAQSSHAFRRDVPSEISHQVVEHELHAAAVLQLFVHDDPHAELEFQRARQDAGEP